MIYLDCNATTPLEPRVLEQMRPYFETEFGNAGSHGHEYGARAKQAVQFARRQVAEASGVSIDDVVFTSGATESNNLAILGLSEHGRQSKKLHLITTAIEHKAVLEPMLALVKSGFELTVLPTDRSGFVDPQSLLDALRPDTLLVSVMQVNNETGVRQPIAEICEAMGACEAYLHIDAAQGFGKEPMTLRSDRIDLISVSGHKIYGPKGIGAVITRRREGARAPLQPLMWGGGQERGLRPGTLPVPLIVGLGAAAALAAQEHDDWAEYNQRIKDLALDAFQSIGAQTNGDPGRAIPHTLNVSIPGVNSEAAMLVLKGVAAISNGSACTSASYEHSHVLKAMGLAPERIEGALRFSWCHMTPEIDWDEIVARLRLLI